jgi:hypothetical protein
VSFGQELAATGEVFQIKELVFFEAMNGFDIALKGVSGRWDTHMLAVTESLGEVAFEFTAVVGLPDQIAERDAVAIQMLLNAGSEGRRSPPPERFCAKAQKSRLLGTSREGEVFEPLDEKSGPLSPMTR